MSVAEMAKAKVEALTEKVGRLHKLLQELAEVGEQCTPEEYETLREAEEIFFDLSGKVRWVLYSIRGRNGDEVAETAKLFLEEVDKLIRYLDETFGETCSDEGGRKKN